MTVHPTLVIYDEGRQNLGLINPGQPGTNWDLDLSEIPMARDLQKLSGGRILAGFDRGYFEVDLATGQVVHLVSRWSGVTSVRRLPDGCTLVTGLNLAGQGIFVLTLDPDDRLIATASRPGNYVRLMRPTCDDTWLLGSDDHFLETDKNLKEIRRLSVPGFQHAWLAHRCENGCTVISAGYGAYLCVVDSKGRPISLFGQKSQVPTEVEPFFYASFALLPDGGILAANWQGHGTDRGKSGRQLVEFGPDHRYRGSWSYPERFSSVQGLVIA